MKEDLYQYIALQGGNMTVQEVLVSFVAAVVLALLIFVSYRFSHAGTVYSAKFNVSLVMITVVTTVIMCVIGNNVALSLGMVGALSIVRFRTAIKDPRDTAYIFWAVAVGVCCGIQDYTVAAIGSGTVFFIMLFLGNVRSNNRYLLIVRAGEKATEQIHSAVMDYFGDRASLKVSNGDRNEMELIYEVSEYILKKYTKKNHDENIRTRLLAISDVNSVNLVCQDDEITR